jgi:hypothetical protein
MLWVVVAKERRDKQLVQAEAMIDGLRGHGVKAEICLDDPPNDKDPFIARGQLWVVERIVPKALKTGQPFWIIDNGFYKYGRGGYYKITYKGLSPIVLKNPDTKRFPPEKVMHPWIQKRSERGYVLIGVPGPKFGKCLGIDVPTWIKTIYQRVRANTNRRVIVREKWTQSPTLAEHLAGAHVLVTHSSNIAVDAIIQGVPAIVESTNPAAPVCAQSLDYIERPLYPDRRSWWRSLMCQQFNDVEMSNGLAWHWMKKVQEQVDGEPLPSNWVGA